MAIILRMKHGGVAYVMSKRERELTGIVTVHAAHSQLDGSQWELVRNRCVVRVDGSDVPLLIEGEPDTVVNAAWETARLNAKAELDTEAG